MKKRILTYLLALLAVLTMLVPTWAEQTEDDLFIYDTVGLLDEDEWLELEMMADEISWRYNCAVYIVTVEDYEEYGSNPYDAAANIYNGNDFGIGEGRDGILLLQSTWARDYGLYIRDGYANSMVGKYARTLLEDAFLDNFADDDYRGGYEDYLSTCADFFERAAQGHPVRKPLIKVLPLALGIGLGLALLAALCWGIEGCVGGRATCMVDPQIAINIRQLVSGLGNLCLPAPPIMAPASAQTPMPTPTRGPIGCL